MQIRSCKSVTLEFDAWSGVSGLEYLEKLAVPLAMITQTQSVIRRTLNENMSSARKSKLVWLLLPLGLALIVGACVLVPFPLLLVPVCGGLLLWNLLAVYFYAKQKNLVELVQKTRNRVEKVSNGVLTAEADPQGWIWCRCCPKVLCFEIVGFTVRVRPSKEREIPQFVFRVLEEHSKLISGGSRSKPGKTDTEDSKLPCGRKLSDNQVQLVNY